MMDWRPLTNRCAVEELVGTKDGPLTKLPWAEVRLTSHCCYLDLIGGVPEWHQCPVNTQRRNALWLLCTWSIVYAAPRTTAVHPLIIYLTD